MNKTHPYLPWLLVLIFCIWFTHPLWSHPHLFFAVHPTGDNIRSMHFYDFIGHELWNNEPITTFHQFDVPDSPSVREYFPAILEAYIMAPLVWLFPWPQHWPIILCASLLINAYGAMLLVRSLGGGKINMTLVGCAVITLRPIWADIANGRINSITPGYALFAFACSLLLLKHTLDGKKISSFKRSLSFVGAVVFGYCAALVYPPYILLLLPFGFIILLFYIRRKPIGNLTILLVAVLFTLILSSSELEAIKGINDTNFNCQNVGCGSERHIVRLQNLFLTAPLSLVQGGISILPWIGGLLVLVSRKRLLYVSLLAIIIVYSLLSGGPCPTWMNQSVQEQLQFLQPIWCQSSGIHDFRRYSTIVAVMLVVLSGAGLQRLLVGNYTQIPTLILCTLGLGWAAQQRQQEILDRSLWHALPQEQILSEFVSENDLIVELPYDLHYQFVSALIEKDIRRLNPYENQIDKRDPFSRWIHEIGYGRLPKDIPSREVIYGAGIDWIFFDRTRCEYAIAPKAGCQQKIVTLLTRTLGEPSEMRGLLIWKLKR
ncbi:MAG: hypothetical protein VX278_24130 [Myxococcota bacterium]|nr:hypothetical protein [Myxococcota bacterium]